MKKVVFLLVLILAAGCNSKVCPAYTDSTNKMQSTIFQSGSSRADGIHRVYRDSPHKRWFYFSSRKVFFILDEIISNYSGKIIIVWLQLICTIKCCLYMDYKQDQSPYFNKDSWFRKTIWFKIKREQQSWILKNLHLFI